MKKIAFKISIIPMVLILFSFLLPEKKEAPTTTFSLTITVKGLKNSTGHVQYSIYNKDGSIPDEEFTNYYRQKNAIINKKKSTITFKNLPKGRYAINILHDENKNGIIEKGWFLPIEGIGFSNYETIGLMNRPSFSGASFNLHSNSTKVVNVIYM